MAQTARMIHKDFPDRRPAVVDKAAFERVWKDKGWRLVEEGEIVPADPYPRALDGGWYELSNGEKIQKQEDAIKAEEKLQAERAKASK